MSANAQWVWEVSFADPDDIDQSLLDGWEPFAVTLNVHNQRRYHLRRKVKK